MRRLLLLIASLILGTMPAHASSAPWILFASDSAGSQDVWMIRSDGTGLHQVTTSARFESGPVWSPDGARIAYFSDHDGDFEIFTMNIDGTGVSQLTHNNASDSFPVWSSTNKIAFVSTRDANKWGTPELYVMNADGSGQTRLTSNESQDVYPTWAPDGSRLYYVSSPNIEGTEDIFAEGYQIFSMKPDGTDVVQLTHELCASQAPSVSPDGTTIAFSSDCGRLYVGISLMNIDGTNVRSISPDVTAYEDWPTWSPDGSKLTFASTHDGVPIVTTDIFTMNANGSGVQNVTNSFFDSDVVPWFAPALS